MRIHLLRMLAAAASLAAPVSAAFSPQGPGSGPPPRGTSLADVSRLFAEADSNGDGRLSAREPSVLRWGPQLLRESDQDGDGTFSKEEFVVGHHRHLVRSGQAVARDLEAEATRIQAVWRARRSEELQRLRRAAERSPDVEKSQGAPSARAKVPPPPPDPTVRPLVPPQGGPVPAKQPPVVREPAPRRATPGPAPGSKGPAGGRIGAQRRAKPTETDQPPKENRPSQRSDGPTKGGKRGGFSPHP